MRIILGPPGTGKTTDLIQKVETYLKDGTSPDKICYITFTRKGAYEAKERALRKLSLRPEDLPYFRTIHSLAFYILKMETRDIMTFRDYVAIANSLGLTITSQRLDDDLILGQQQTKGDRLIFMENLARTTMTGLEAVWKKFINDDIPLGELEMFQKILVNYKSTNQKIDFTDILTMFIENQVAPPFDVLFVDEGQDLSALQWQVVRLLMTNSLETYVAGDDDQAIYSWAGADVDYFINLQGPKVVLSQSYRVPSKIHNIAVQITDRIKHRNAKAYKPRWSEGAECPDGVVKYYSDLEQIKDMNDGTWLLLARNTGLLADYVRYCMARGYLFETKHQCIVDASILPAIVTWEGLRQGRKATASQIKNMYERMASNSKIKRGFKQAMLAQLDDVEFTIEDLKGKFGLLVDEPWYQAFNRVDIAVINYIRFCLRNGEAITHKPRIVISTIHGVKGGEAENVVLMQDMTARTFHHSSNNPDDEHRVWYVAVTRAKIKLHVIRPKTPYFYDLPVVS